MTEPRRTSHYMVRDRWTTRAGEWVLYALAWILRQVTRPFGTWALAAALAPIGAALFMAVPSVRRRALDNLALVWPDMPEVERRRIAREAAGQFTRLAVEYAHLDRLVRTQRIDVVGEKTLQAAKAAGKGAILVTAHYGNWEAARIAALKAGYETGIIYRAFNNRYLDRYAMDLIPCAGTPVVQKGRQGMRQLVMHVSRGGFAMILVDQRNSGAPWLEFLGKPAETVTAAGDLALRSGAALIPVRARRNVETRSFEVTFEDPIPATDGQTMMQAVNDRISAWIVESPEQWFWFHRRWRRTARSVPQPALPPKGPEG